jgi:hypothetical protein
MEVCMKRFLSVSGASLVLVTSGTRTLCCPADIDNGSGSGTSDGGVDVNDLLFFLSRFGSGDFIVDLDDGTGTGTPDNGVDINDLLFFLAHFGAGC